MSSVKKLLILDAVGALISAFMLGVVLVRFQSVFGIPISALKILSSIPVGFMLYDLLALLSNSELQPRRLMTIGTLNILYCILSLTMAIWHRGSLSIYGWGYIIIEVIIVVALAVYELKVGRKFISKSH